MTRVDELVKTKAFELSKYNPKCDTGSTLDCYRQGKFEGAMEMASYLRSPEMQRAMVEERIGELESALVGIEEMFSDLNVYEQIDLRSITRAAIERRIAAYRTILEHLK